MPAKKHTHNNDSGKKNFLCVCAEIFHFPMPKFEFWCVGYPTFRKRGLQITAMWLATRCWEITGNSVSTEVSESLIVMWRSIGTCTQYVLPVRGIFSCPAPIQCVISPSVVLTACFSPLDGVERLAVVWSTRLHPYTTWEESCRWANFCDVSRRGLSLRFFVARFVFFAFSLFRSVAFSLFVFVAMPQRKKIFKPSHARKKFCFSAVFSYSFFHSSSEQLHKFHTRKQRDHIKSN